MGEKGCRIWLNAGHRTRAAHEDTPLFFAHFHQTTLSRFVHHKMNMRQLRERIANARVDRVADVLFSAIEMGDRKIENDRRRCWSEHFESVARNYDKRG